MHHHDQLSKVEMLNITPPAERPRDGCGGSGLSRTRNWEHHQGFRCPV